MLPGDPGWNLRDDRDSSRTCANGKLEEQFVWLMIGGKATLLKYNANNPLLLTD